MAEIPSSIDITSQTDRNLRISQIRELNTLDGIVVVSNDYESANMVKSNSGSTASFASEPEWSRGLNVKGYDTVTLLVTYTHDTADTATDVCFQVQCSYQQRGSADELWFNRAVSFDLREGNSNLIPVSDVMTFAVPGALAGSETLRFAFDVNSLGHYMRFRPFLDAGTTVAGSRITIHAIRDQSGF